MSVTIPATDTLVSLVGTPPSYGSTSDALIAALLGAGLTETHLLSVQVDGSAGGHWDGVQAPPGTAYAWATLDDSTPAPLLSAAVTVFSAFGAVP